ncbi:DUF4214 domain-containing protein, partial [Duganella sp. OV510]|uniref:DUF4214 domain-containing protein n=1 Tax=Duganella sp. OV510 TaxID=1881039 RepID=UPI00088A1793
KMSEQELKDQRKEFTNQYDELMLTTAQLAAKARAAIDPYNLALYDQIQAQTAVKDAQAALLDAYDKQKSALQSVIDLQLAAAAATEKQINALKLGTLSDLSPEQKYFEAQRQFDAAAPGEAKSAAAQALLDASRTYNGSTQAYVKDYAKVQAALALQAASQSSAASVAQQQLDALNKQVAPLIDIKDGITGLDATTKAVLDGIQELARATAAAAAANTAAGASGSGQSVEAMVAGIYKDVLGRQGDAAGMDFWIKQIKNGASYSQIYDALKGSDEYKYLNGIKAHAKGGIASGWSLVGEEGPELVNFDTPGRVYTADQSRRMMSGGTSDAAVAEQTAAIREQNALIAKQNELLGAIKDATEDTAENGAAGEDIRSLKQHMAKVLSTRQAVPA